MTKTYSAHRLAIAMAIFAALASSNVLATNGLAPIGLGMEHRAMGGVGAGYASNTSSMATNPAAAAWVADGYDVGLELFRPDREATFNGKAFGMPGNQTFDGNGKENFFVPEASYKRGLKGGLNVGIAAYGNGGMNTEYGVNPGFGTGTAGVDYQQLFIAPTIAYKAGDNHAIGVSANLVYHRFKAEGLQNFDNPMFSASPTHVTNNDYDSGTGVGFAIGWQGKVAPTVSAGVAYRSKVNMDKFEKYAGLFANGGEFDVPGAVTVGFAWQINPATTLAADVQRIYYSDAEAIHNSSSIQKQFGADGGPGFGWDDMTVYKVGVKHQLNSKWSLMAGYNQGDNPIKSTDTTLNVIAPGVTEKHLALGAQMQVSPKAKLNFTYVHALEGETKGKNTVPPPGPVPLDGYDLKMKQDTFGVSYSYSF